MGRKHGQQWWIARSNVGYHLGINSNPLDSSEAVGYQRMDQAFGLSVHSQLQSIAAETPWQSHDVFWVLGVSNFRPPSNRFWMFWTPPEF